MPAKKSSMPGICTSWLTPDVAEVAAAAGGAYGLHEGLLGADRLDDGVGAVARR